MIANTIIRIHAETPNSFEWLTLDADGVLIDQGQSEFSALKEHLENWQGKPLTLLLPGKSCLNIQHNIPAKNPRQIKAALPYAVEEQFAEDIENLHFAIGQRSDDGEVSALVVSNEILQSWLSYFDDLDYAPKLVTADHQALPSPADAAVLMVSTEYSLLRLKSGMSYSLPNAMLSKLLQQFATASYPNQKVAEDANKDSKIEPNADPSEDSTEPKALEKLLLFNAGNLTKEEQQSIAQFWDLQINPTELESSTVNELLILAQNATSAHPINLLQGSFRRRTASGKNWKIWQFPALAVAIMLVLMVSVWGLDYYSLKSKFSQLKQAQVSVYKNTFPRETRVIRPVSQMRGKINALGSGSSEGSFLPLLNKFSMALSKVNKTQITNLNFRAKRGELKIAFLAPDFATIQKLQSELKALKLDVTAGASNAAGDQYSGRVTIKDNN